MKTLSLRVKIEMMILIMLATQNGGKLMNVA